jgi:hypothetical protein
MTSLSVVSRAFLKVIVVVIKLKGIQILSYKHHPPNRFYLFVLQRIYIIPRYYCNSVASLLYLIATISEAGKWASKISFMPLELLYP